MDFLRKKYSFVGLSVGNLLKKNVDTLNVLLPHEDSSDFDEFWTELIVTTLSIIWDKLRFFRIFSFVVVVVEVVVVNYFHY